MRADAGRTKKLIAAFQFQFANQAGWKCGECRKSGLEEKRRCGYLGERESVAERVVWARRGVALTECPRSYISAESLGWLESWTAWKALGGGAVEGLAARAVDAFLTLEKELQKEIHNGSEQRDRGVS